MIYHCSHLALCICVFCALTFRPSILFLTAPLWRSEYWLVLLTLLYIPFNRGNTC